MSFEDVIDEKLGTLQNGNLVYLKKTRPKNLSNKKTFFRYHQKGVVLIYNFVWNEMNW